MSVGRELTTLLAQHEVLDLTLPLAEDLPCTWPGHMPFRATVWTWFADRPDDPQPVRAQAGGNYQTRWLVIDEHTGTHLDAPRHFLPPPDSGLPHSSAGGRVGISDLAVTAASGPADVIDVRDLLDTGEPGTSPRVTVEHFTRWERENGRIEPGDVVLLHSGWDRHYVRGADGSSYGSDVLITGQRPGWPAATGDAVDWLLERDVRCVGTDGLSWGAADDGAPAHLGALGNGLAVVEALTGLERLPARGAWFLFLPIRLEAGSGGPGRALAVV